MKIPILLKLLLLMLLFFTLYISSKIYLLSFIFIILHELTHCLTGLLLGYKLNYILVLPFGMTANFKDEFIKPIDDIIISSTGPLINFIFFILFMTMNSNDLFDKASKINLALTIINLIPVDFLDGGRIFKNIIKYFFSIYYSYIVTCLNGIIFGCIIIIAIVTKGLVTYNNILFLSIGLFFLIKSIESNKNKRINIIKDIIYKKNDILANRKLDISIRIYDENNKILDIIKFFCFNKYHITYIMRSGVLVDKIDETDLISIYFSYGNILLKDCIKLINKQEDNDV